jgi:hypothetical protein
VSTSTDPPPNYTWLYDRVGISAFLIILGAGVTGFATGRISLGVFLGILGISIVGIALMVHLLKWYRFTTLHFFISAIIALLAGWIITAYVLWPKPTIYVNPIHTEATKWNMAKNLQWWRVATSPQHPNCQIAIVRYPETYSQDYASDFKEILDVAGWKYTRDHIVVDGTLQNGITMRGNHDDHLSKTCAEELDSRIQNDGRSRSGMGIYLEWPSPADLSDFIKHCPPEVGCVEVTFGNEDTTR